MENETREVTYLAVSLMIIALVLGFITYGLGLTSRMAQARNEQIVANSKIEEYREFNGYDAKTLIGDEVIELIRQKYDTGIDIFVDYRYNESTRETVTAGINDTCTYCAAAARGDHRVYNSDLYYAHVDTDEDYFTLAVNKTSATRDDMRNWYPTDAQYRAYLVYNSEDPIEFYSRLISNYNAVRGSYGSDLTGKLEALDSGIGAYDPNLTVTGIVLVNLKNLGIS